MKFPRWSNKSRSKYRVGFSSDVGLTRMENQDSVGVFPAGSAVDILEDLFIVADGMGGHEFGKKASSLAVDTVSTAFRRDGPGDVKSRLRGAYQEANQRIYEFAIQIGEGTSMGTTCTSVAVVDGAVWVAHIGDSRAYRIGKDRMDQLTTDHTFVEELIREGVLTESEALTDPRRHTLTRAMGIEERCEPDVFSIPELASGEKLLLCSDGLFVVPEEQIATAVRAHPVQAGCERLVAMANQQGGPDNVTIVIIDRT